MLVTLSVKNFAIIDNIQIDFGSKMTVLTGETGAGKSLIIDAIGLLFGKRASSDLIRFGESKAIIEGVFSSISDKVKEILGSEDCEEDFLIIRREIFNNGKSICKVNNTMVTLSQLSEISETLGDIHTQFDTQGLFNPKNYLQFLDSEENLELIKTYQQELSVYGKFYKEYQDLLKKNREDTERFDFLKYQIAEIEKSAISISEEEELKQRSSYLTNFETVRQNANEFIGLFNKDILDSVFQGIGILQKLETFEPKFSTYRKQMEDGYYNLSDAVESAIHEFSKIDFDSDELDRINDRLGLYSDLKRKYKKSTEEIVAYYQSLKKEIETIENYDFLLSELEKNVKKSFDKTLNIAKNIRANRMIAAKTLETKIKENLVDLQLKNTEFSVSFNEISEIGFKGNGIDEIDFLITFNKGEPLRPLSKVASGGELSRFMLALKTLVSEKFRLQTIIFDEIDNGVSGAVAFSIANKIKTIAKESQVLCVTHLPQVAAIADHHMNIKKKIDNDNRTITEIEMLNDTKRILEIAKMISNGEITEASKNLAAELLHH